MLNQYEKIGLMGLVVESNLKKHEKLALIETIKESNNIELITSVLVEFNVIDEGRGAFLSKIGKGLRGFGKKVKTHRQDIDQSQIRTHLKQPKMGPAGLEVKRILNSAL